MDCALQVYDLEKKGGSIIGGVLALMRERKANPPPARDERLPPKPAGQTVGSFRTGLTMLPEAIAANMTDKIKCGLPSLCCCMSHIMVTIGGSFCTCLGVSHRICAVRFVMWIRSSAACVPALLHAMLLGAGKCTLIKCELMTVEGNFPICDWYMRQFLYKRLYSRWNSCWEMCSHQGITWEVLLPSRIGAA